MTYQLGVIVAIFAVAACGGAPAPELELEANGRAGGAGSSGGVGGGGVGGGGDGEGGVGRQESVPECADWQDYSSINGPGAKLPACRAGEDEDACGLDLTPLRGIFPGMDGCMERDQPAASEPGDCEGFTMETHGGDIPLPACCRLVGTCGVHVDFADLGEALGVRIAPGNFGCVDPLPLLAPVSDEKTPDFWKNSKAHPEDGAPPCVE